MWSLSAKECWCLKNKTSLNVANNLFWARTYRSKNQRGFIFTLCNRKDSTEKGIFYTQSHNPCFYVLYKQTAPCLLFLLSFYCRHLPHKCWAKPKHLHVQCIYTPACVWHILPLQRTSLCSSFRGFHKLITSRQQWKYDSSLVQSERAVVVIVGVSESVKDHKQRVWTGSSWFTSRAGKQHNFVDLCTRRTQKKA